MGTYGPTYRKKAAIASAVSRFTLWGSYLPLAMCYSTSLQDGVRVLVVDSHPDSCELLVLLLDQCGIETTVATSVSQAIELIHQAPPDLLISEILLPGEDGYSLMHRVKTLETKLHVQIPAIACWENNSGEFISANSVVPPSNIGSATHESTLYLRLGTRR